MTAGRRRAGRGGKAYPGRAAKGGKTPTIPPVIAEHGLTAQWLAGLVVVEDAPDPDRPRHDIRRPRRADPLRSLGLSVALMDAAERLRRDHELAEGARDSERTGTGYVAPWSRWHWAEAVAAARAARTAAFEAIEDALSAVHVHLVLAVVLAGKGLRAAEDALRLRHGSAADMLRRTLNVLAAHYGAA